MQSPGIQSRPGPLPLPQGSPSQYGPPERRAALEPSNKILHSILSSFTSASYMNGLSRGHDMNGLSRGHDMNGLSRGHDMNGLSRGHDMNGLNRGLDMNSLSRDHDEQENRYQRSGSTQLPINESSRNMRSPQSPQRPPNYRHTMYPHSYDPQALPTRYYTGPSSTVTSQARSRDSLHSDKYLSPRHRSSSIGSAGSSFRDSRSPSHDSTGSHDSISRCSPMSVSSSPSPSPPNGADTNSSKLLGILKGGSYSHPYSSLPRRNSRETNTQTMSSSFPSRSSGPPNINTHPLSNRQRSTSQNGEYSNPYIGTDHDLERIPHRDSYSHNANHSPSMFPEGTPTRDSYSHNANRSPSMFPEGTHRRHSTALDRLVTSPVPLSKRHHSVSSLSAESHHHLPLDARLQYSQPFYRPVKRHISAECQDQPIDLSCKSKKIRTDNLEQNENPPSVDSGLSWGSEYYSKTSSVEEDSSSQSLDPSPRKSILETILRGFGSSDVASQLSVKQESREVETPCSLMAPSHAEEKLPLKSYQSPVSPEHDRCLSSSSVGHEHSFSSPTSPVDCPPAVVYAGSPVACSSAVVYAGSLPASTPPSPAPSVASQYSISSLTPSCPWRQRVTLAKKNLLPVSARVSDWIHKIIAFAKSLPEFGSLPDNDKVILMQESWSRLMLLYMAETNFFFAVTPVREETDTGRPPAISGIDPTEPTMDSVEKIQNFIRKCQNLVLESQEYDFLRKVTLFHPGCAGLENAGFVENISSKARQALNDYVTKTHDGMEEKMRYSNLLLCLHTICGINCGMMQTLFCKHVAKGCDMDKVVRERLLLRCTESEDSSDTEETQQSQPRHMYPEHSPVTVQAQA